MPHAHANREQPIMLASNRPSKVDRTSRPSERGTLESRTVLCRLRHGSASRLVALASITLALLTPGLGTAQESPAADSPEVESSGDIESSPRGQVAETTLTDEPAPLMLIVRGPGGEERYDQRFAEWSAAWQSLAMQAGMEVKEIGPVEEQRSRITEALEAAPTNPRQPNWLVVIAHGAFDSRQAQINLRGPDFTPAQLAERFNTRGDQWVIIQGSASSGPFLQALSNPRRIVVTATRGPHEASATRWHEYLIAALSTRATESDLDLDEQVSLWEAFVWASRSVTESFETERLVVTEHALLDDNGDGVGSSHQELVSLRNQREAALRGEVEDVADSPPMDEPSNEGLRAARVVLVPSAWELARSPQWRADRDRLEAELAELRRESADPRDPRLLALLDQLASHYAGGEATERESTDDSRR